MSEPYVSNDKASSLAPEQPPPLSRREKFARPPITLSDIAKSVTRSLQPIPRAHVHQTHRFLPPDALPASSRSRVRRRARRLARRRRLRILRAIRRAGGTAIIAVALFIVVFWAKFAIVYHVPAFAQQGNLQGVSAYVAYKSWWFGPPIFNLKDYVVPSSLDPWSSLLGQLERYRGIIADQGNILFVIRGNS